MKNHCALCLRPIINTVEHYKEYGNMCKNCSDRIGRVMYGTITRKQADAELSELRKLNVSLHKQSQK